VGKTLAADIVSGRLSNTLALSGELGSGKTTFVQGLAKGLGVNGRIISPTFIIVRKYPLTLKFKNFYHVDLYRLEGDLDREVLNLGLPYIWSEPESIMVIEWAEKIRALVPSGATWITFEDMGESKRRLLVK
jgi:tRNA threonylcarbamoyladenosine biosynthesis protein TsaE